MKNRNINVVTRKHEVVMGTDNGAGNETVFEVPQYKSVGNIQVSTKGIVLTADNSAVAAVAGDDITISGGFTNAGPWVNLGAANAALVYGLDDAGVTNITSTFPFLQFSAAQIAGTETWNLDLVLSSEG